jgi:hypothetical protein
VTAVDAARREVELQRIGGDERGVVLRAEYLDYRTANGEPSLQHAYAISAYAAESKTFEQAFTLLDAGASREEFLVSVSRSRGPTTAYGVAALELTDAELGPGTRTIEDPAHEIRVAAERPGEERPAHEVSPRQRVAAMNEFGLSERLRELEERQQALERVSPAQEQLTSLDRSIVRVEEQLAALRSEYAELVAERRPDAERVEVVSAAGRDAGERLGLLRGERVELAERVGSEERPSPLTPVERMELGLIEERMTQLRRRDIALERLDPSPMVREALGERPSDPVKVAAWNEGVDAIYSYRQRHNIRTHELGALGAEPNGERARSDLQKTQRRLEQVRAVLDRGRSAEQAVEQDIGIEI